MSDDGEESMSEGFSASEDEWKPTKDVRGGESSDDDDSDYEDSRQTTGEQNVAATGAAARRKPTATKGAVKQTGIKKRKSAGQSLRTKLYNKYRPPPKTFPSPNSGGSNSPSASTSRTASKNAKVPNESGGPGNDSSSESSVEDYLVNPSDINLQSSFFNVRYESKGKSTSPPPIFDCNAGITKLSDSGSEDNNDSSAEEQGTGKVFNFANLLDNVNSLEHAKATIAKRAAETKNQETKKTGNTVAMDVNSLLALGEKQGHAVERSVKPKDDGEEEDDEECEEERAPQKLSKTKSTRVKRHTKTRPASTVVAGDTDDSDFEEVAEDTSAVSHSTTYDSSALLNTTDGLEIHVDMPTKQRRNKEKTKQDLELALKRKLNRDLKERFLNLHKTTLLCCFARSYRYNRMLNDTPLMQAALKLLPSSNAYPPESGTEIEYYQSMVTWYKTAVKLTSPNLYGEKVRRSRRRVRRELLAQIKRKEASCKQDFVLIFVVLLRAMGLQCRLIVNMQPLPLRPAQSDLLTIKLKRDGNEEIDEPAKPKKFKGEECVVSEKEENLPSGSAKKADSGRSVINKEKCLKEETKKKKVSLKEGENIKVDKEKALNVSEKKENKVLSTNDKQRTNKDASEAKQRHEKDQAPLKSTIKERKKAPSSKLAEKKIAEKAGGKEILSEVPHSSLKRTQVKVVNKKQSQPEELKEKKVRPDDDVNVIYLSQEVDAIKTAQPTQTKPKLSRLRNQKIAAESKVISELKPSLSVGATPIARRTRKASTEKAIAAAKCDKSVIQVGSPVIPKIVIQSGKAVNIFKQDEDENQAQSSATTRPRDTRSRSKSPKMHISPSFLQSTDYKNKFAAESKADKKMPPKGARANSKSPVQKIQISTDFLHQQQNTNAPTSTATRILRSRQKSNVASVEPILPTVPQLDGADDSLEKLGKKRRPQLQKLNQKSKSRDDSDDDFEPSPPKQPKKAPKSQPKQAVKNRRVLSSDEEESSVDAVKLNPTAADIWVEVWSDAEEQWVCIELFKGKLHSVEAIRKAASSSFAYVFAFQNDLSIKDVTARYCSKWTTTVRKSRVDRSWLEAAFASYNGQRTQRDIREDQELRRIHEEKPMPTTISEYKDHPLYALERHLLKFQAIYPPNPPTLGFVRGEAVYARECIHTLHSREIWLKQARTVKLGEQPYKIVKARPKWDRLTQTVIKDQPLEIFGYWQTEDYEPPTAENGIVPRNAYGNVELFKDCMLPKKTVHLRLAGLNRICKKLGIDCAQAVTGFDFHQGACHPLYDGFIVCEEFGDQVTAAWYQDQEEQEKKEQEKYEARVYGNWKKLIKGLLIRERLKKKYNF